MSGLDFGYAVGQSRQRKHSSADMELCRMASFSANMGNPMAHTPPQQQAAQQYAQNHPAFAGSQSRQQSEHVDSAQSTDSQFDIFEWHPKYVSCQRYFLDHAQHSAPVQAMAAFMNILLPCQRVPSISSSRTGASGVPGTRSPAFPNPYSSPSQASISTPAPPTFPSPDPPATSLFPYLRRLVVTGLDFPGVLHGFFGDDWAAGIGPLHEQERRNLLFAAKSSGWMGVKKDYDMGCQETVPFLRPLQQAVEVEVGAAERSWSEWLAMEDWMVGPRAPPAGQNAPGQGNQAPGPASPEETRMTGTERVGDVFA